MRTKFSGILTLLLALVVQLTFAQQKTITGTVTDDTGLPLPGANVIIKGTSTGTQSDFDGNYTISANVGQTLTFSYVGFDTKEVKVGTQNKIDITLEPGESLSEVVVTGYSTRNQTVQTSAVVSISASEIAEMAPTTSVDNLLQGKAAGVQVTSANGKPGQGAFVRIRGTGSLTAGASSPLYIVDGIPIREEELNNIPNDDIENISILKDAAVTSRYGSRGSNGVVVITTKSGNRNKEATIRFSSRYGTTSRIEPNFTMMNAEQKLQFEAEMYAFGIGGTQPGVTTLPGSPERQQLLNNAVDWEELVLKDGQVQSNNVSISGGAEKADYYFSVGHDKNTGIIDKLEGYERLNSRLNLNIDPKEWLSVGVNVGYSRSTSDEPRDRNNVQNPFRAMLDLSPYETEFKYDEDGNLLLDDDGNPIYNDEVHVASGFNIRNALITEPSKDIENLTLGSVDSKIMFSKNFSYGFNIAVSHLNRRIERYSFPGGVLDRILSPGNPTGRKTDATTQRLDMTVSNRLNYNLNSNNHNLNVLGLYEYNFNEINFIRAVAEGFSSSSLTTIENASTILDFDAEGNHLTTSQRSRLALLSYGVFADYDFGERYLLSASIRRDGSSNFGADYKYGTFWSVSAGWNLAKESFMDVDGIDDLKIRGSYGTVGNRTGIGRYQALGTVVFASYPGGASTVVDQIANPELKWETTSTLNVGLEFNLLNRRIRGVADYFERKTEDLLFDIPRAAESGISNITGNLGTIQNNGVELSLAADLFRSSDFTWTIGGNILIQTKSEIVSLPNGDPIDAPNTFSIRYEEGRKINEHYMVRYAGVDPQNGRAQYLNADGELIYAPEVTDEDRVFQGKSTIADKEGGFFTDVKYKGFGLRTDFVFKAGNYINNAVKADRYFDPNYSTSIADNFAVGAFNYWQQPGDTDVLPSPKYATSDLVGTDTDQFLEKGDYIRMRNITLSYSFPSKFLEKTPINSFRIYAQGQNLLTFTKFWGDPEVGISSGETISFADTVAPGEATLYSYPNTKSIQVGFDVSF
tara:strand:+ start:332 stop:3427 length:3096 start_codon:yes stop_codon:yes gene_type:complete